MNNVSKQIELASQVKNNLISKLKKRIEMDKKNDYENVEDERNSDDLRNEFAEALMVEARKEEVDVDGFTNNEAGLDEVNDTCNDYAHEASRLIECAIAAL